MRGRYSTIGVALIVAAPAASATDAMNSSDAPGNGEASDARGDHSEFNLVPIVGGSTDIGFGGGYFGKIARIRKGYDPFFWSLESAATFTVKAAPAGGVELPVQDIYATLTIPRLFGRALRFDVRPSYTWEILQYYGMGNGAVDATRAGRTQDYVSYARLHPQLDTNLHIGIVDHIAVLAGVRYTENWLQPNADSELTIDQQAGSAEVKHLVGGFAQHGVILLKTGVYLDDRDNEVSTHTGTFDELNFKFSPGGSTEFPYRYEQMNVIARIFIPLSKPAVTLAVRVVGDILFGDAPFYELSRYEDTYAIGGSLGVRGVPAQRYYGKAKVFTNIELRTELVSFRALGKPLVFGVTGFFDGGRVWADTHSEPALDGSGVGLKFGTGIGLRLQSGSAFVLRAEVAWSPDANPIGGYFVAGQAF